MSAASSSRRSRHSSKPVPRSPGLRKRRHGLAGDTWQLSISMEQRVDDGLSPYTTYTRSEWAALREDMPMTLSPDEVNRLRSMHDRLDMKEVEDIYLPLSRLLSLYVAATQRLHRGQQRFLGGEEAKLPYIIGVAG